MYKRLVASVSILIGLGIATYFVYIRHPPTDDILAANKARRKVLSGPRGKLALGKEDYYYYDEEVAANPVLLATWKWDAFIEDRGYVNIGELYDKCDGDDRIMIGRTILTPDELHGGVKSRSFVNFTLPVDLTGGWMYIECQYNGHDLYSNHWDICTVEDDMESPRIIFCPIPGGKKRMVKDLYIPSMLPKGTYTIKSWLMDQNDRLFVCAYSEFTL